MYDTSFEEAAKEIFDELRGTSSKLSVASFRKWEDVVDMLNQGVFSEEELDSMAAEVLGKKKTMSLEQFLQLIARLDDFAIKFEQEEVEGSDDKEEVEVEVDSEEKEVEVEEEEENDSAREIFDLLKDPTSGLVPVSSFLRWEEVKEMVSSDVITEQKVMDMVDKVAGPNASKKKGSNLTFAQFDQLVLLMDEETTSSSDEEVNREIFDELANGKDRLKVADFLKWEEIQELQQLELISSEGQSIDRFLLIRS